MPLCAQKTAPKTRFSRQARVLPVAGLLALAAGTASADIQYYLQGSWPADKRAAAEAALSAAVGRFNAYGGFEKVLNIYYEPGVPTADGNFNGTIRFGSSISINERVTLHEICHTLGTGTTGNYQSLMTNGTWDGSRGLAMIRQFDGATARINGDTAHFWPYGLNQDNEGSEINKARCVALAHAMIADMGLGPAEHPSTATEVNLSGHDVFNTSGFNYPNWSDGYFPHAGADYFTGNFAMRTPASADRFAFRGNSLTVNNDDATGGLWFKGAGTSGLVTISDLILDGGWITHLSGVGDIFLLQGGITVADDATLWPKQGNMHLFSEIAGDATLTVRAGDNPADDNRYVRVASSGNTFTGDWEILGRFELMNNARQVFAASAGGASNTIFADDARRVLLNGFFEIDLDTAGVMPGDAWTLVSGDADYGASFRVEGFTEESGVWTDGAGLSYDEATGVLTAQPVCADLNADGATDFFDVLAHLERAAAGDLSADLAPFGQPDGVLDVQDLAVFIRSVELGGCAD